MASPSTKPATLQPRGAGAAYLFDNWCDPIEAGLQDWVRAFIETMLRAELDAALTRPRYSRQPEMCAPACCMEVEEPIGSDAVWLLGSLRYAA